MAKHHKHNKVIKATTQAIRARALADRFKPVPLRSQHLRSRARRSDYLPGIYDPVLNPSEFKDKIKISVYGAGRFGFRGEV